MGVSTVSKEIDALLGPLGFSRRNKTWSKRTGSFFDVVNLQVSKSGDAITINSGVLDPAVYEACWGEPAKLPPHEPSCTVRARIGMLVEGQFDKWWDVGDDLSARQIVVLVSEYVFPFLNEMHSHRAMVQYLESSSGRRPPESVYIAILMNLCGDHDAACARLRDLDSKAMGDWKMGLREVMARIGCGGVTGTA